MQEFMPLDSFAALDVAQELLVLLAKQGRPGVDGEVPQRKGLVLVAGQLSANGHQFVGDANAMGLVAVGRSRSC